MCIRDSRAAAQRQWEALRLTFGGYWRWLGSIVAAALATRPPSMQTVRQRFLAFGRGIVIFFTSLLPVSVTSAVLPPSLLPQRHEREVREGPRERQHQE